MAKTRVAILGGGVAGLSAAHELAERGFAVTVYERRGLLGGKARSIAHGRATGGRRPLPGEHGFRFFPGFYRHLPDTMRRIPFANQPRGVLGNLVDAPRIEFARMGAPGLCGPARFPRTLSDVGSLIEGAWDLARAGIPAHETTYFLNRMLALATSCDERRLRTFEHQSWWDFIGAPQMSRDYQRLLAIGLSRCLVACRAEKVSARTGGTILLQLMYGLMTPGVEVDRLLNGPTEEVWINPWRKYLETLGVRFERHCRVVALDCDGTRITRAHIEQHAGRRVQSGDQVLGEPAPRTRRVEVVADYYIAALPVEVFRSRGLLSDAMLAIDPALAKLDKLYTAWMNGIQYYLYRDVPVIAGHVTYLDSPWALTSISQSQFWRDPIARDYGDGQVNGILSVDISDWDSPGLHHGPARHCSRRQIMEEVWVQLCAHLNAPGRAPVLERENLADWYLDPDIVDDAHALAHPEMRNLEPLLINTVGSWDSRPETAGPIENLLLASDYVRTYTQLASMEGANEAARRAVNAILDRTGSREPRCALWPLHEPPVLEPLRRLDATLFRRGEPNIFDRPSAQLLESGLGRAMDLVQAMSLLPMAGIATALDTLRVLQTLAAGTQLRR
ncbi:MAG TPA: FAD-dependent oxidoreductase [Candidatus Binataceae bacterium]|nr:FAD-dependent oxidoreductase [Candidatus Binataceae bacterium]